MKQSEKNMTSERQHRESIASCDTAADSLGDLEDNNNDIERTAYRWFILLQLILCLMSTSLVMTTFSTVSNQVAGIYGVKTMYVNSCMSIFLLMTIVMNLSPSVYIIEKCGLSIAFKISAFFTILGCWVRYFALK